MGVSRECCTVVQMNESREDGYLVTTLQKLVENNRNVSSACSALVWDVWRGVLKQPVAQHYTPCRFVYVLHAVFVCLLPPTSCRF
jgi:hypothetical protein